MMPNCFTYVGQGTGLGLTGFSGIYPTDYQQNIFDGYASGPVELFGRKHNMAFGVSRGRTHAKEWAGEFSDEIDCRSSRPVFRAVQLGANLRWQNGTYYVDTGVTDDNGNSGVIRQGGYAAVDLMASAKMVDRLRASISLRNLGNARYLNSLAGGQAHCAAPCTIMGSLTFAYQYCQCSDGWPG